MSYENGVHIGVTILLGLDSREDRENYLMNFLTRSGRDEVFDHFGFKSDLGDDRKMISEFLSHLENIERGAK